MWVCFKLEERIMINLDNVSRFDTDGDVIYFYGNPPQTGGGYAPICTISLNTGDNCERAVKSILDGVSGGLSHILIDLNSLSNESTEDQTRQTQAESEDKTERYCTYNDVPPRMIGGEPHRYTIKISRVGIEHGYFNSKNEFIPASAFTLEPIAGEKPQGILEFTKP